jgi:hypothetical protein
LRSSFVEPTDTPVAFEADTTQPPEVLIDEILSDMYTTEIQGAEARAA